MVAIPIGETLLRELRSIRALCDVSQCVMKRQDIGLYLVNKGSHPSNAKAYYHHNNDHPKNQAREAASAISRCECASVAVLISGRNSTAHCASPFQLLWQT